MSKKLHIAVGLSGGVDSAVTALLLKQQGHEVTALFMQNWEKDRDNPNCTAEQDLSDAQAICHQLGIPLQTVNFSQQYWDHVFQHCLDEFAAGRTPNPDIGCNREIKFKALLDYALSLGADYLATGHYAKISPSVDSLQLLKSTDLSKDQSYFLYALNQSQLAKSLFPLGDQLKSNVRKIAQAAGLINYAKKDSTGICFIGERRFKTFLKEFLLAQPGNIETLEGKVIAQHDGVIFYTIGQRKGLNIGGIKNTKEAAWYVLKKDTQRNVLIVGQGHEHPELYATKLISTQTHWISGLSPENTLHCSAKTRYRQADQLCQIISQENGNYQVIFEKPQRAITPGQSVVFYKEDVCLGGGIIE